MNSSSFATVESGCASDCSPPLLLRLVNADDVVLHYMMHDVEMVGGLQLGCFRAGGRRLGFHRKSTPSSPEWDSSQRDETAASLAGPTFSTFEMDSSLYYGSLIARTCDALNRR